MSTPSNQNTRRVPVIDSHLHVWASSSESMQAFPYLNAPPPDNLQDAGSTEALREMMKTHKVDGALIIQPINHAFDHSYVIQALQKYPDHFKGMLLHDPSLSSGAAIERLEDLALKGFVGVRFNPYLWPKTDDVHDLMSDCKVGCDVYERCGKLRMPVGVMCFHGIDNRMHQDLMNLLDRFPETCMVMDHFGFARTDDQFKRLMSLSKYSQVYVKISALFRLEDTYPYERVRKERFQPLLEAFGAKRLLFGTDFPFVLDQPDGYGGHVNLVDSWIEKDSDREWIMGGTAESLFGPWKK